MSADIDADRPLRPTGRVGVALRLMRTWLVFGIFSVFTYLKLRLRGPVDLVDFIILAVPLAALAGFGIWLWIKELRRRRARSPAREPDQE